MKISNEDLYIIINGLLAKLADQEQKIADAAFRARCEAFGQDFNLGTEHGETMAHAAYVDAFQDIVDDLEHE
jgi:hypothetical protein